MMPLLSPFPCFFLKFILVIQGIYLVDSINGVFLPCQFDLVVRCSFLNYYLGFCLYF